MYILVDKINNRYSGEWMHIEKASIGHGDSINYTFVVIVMFFLMEKACVMPVWWIFKWEHKEKLLIS